MSKKGPYSKEEKEISDLIVKAHNKFSGLQRTHPDEIKEWVDAVHKLQNVLGWRVLRRDYPETFKTFNKVTPVLKFKGMNLIPVLDQRK